MRTKRARFDDRVNSRTGRPAPGLLLLEVWARVKFACLKLASLMSAVKRSALVRIVCEPDRGPSSVEARPGRLERGRRVLFPRDSPGVGHLPVRIPSPYNNHTGGPIMAVKTTGAKVGRASVKINGISFFRGNAP